MALTAAAPELGGELIVWTPTSDDAAHPVTVRNLADVVETEVPGGRLITATVASAGDYQLWVGPVDDQTPRRVARDEPSQPVAAAAPLRPAFTG